MSNKILKTAAAVFTAGALSAGCAVSAGATNWNDLFAYEGSCKVISTNSDQAVFTTGTQGRGAGYACIELQSVVADQNDISRIAKISVDITYKGLNGLDGSKVYAIGGAIQVQTSDNKYIESDGSYFALADSFSSGADYMTIGNDGKKPDWNDTHTFTQTLTLKNGQTASGNINFSDWTSAGNGKSSNDVDLSKYGVTVTLSNLRLYDKNGKAIKQTAWHYTEDYEFRQELLKNPLDKNKIRKIEFKVTYSGLTALNGKDVFGINGNAWTSLSETHELAWSKGYKIDPDSFDENGKPVWLRDNVQVSDTLTLSGQPEYWVFFGDGSYNWSNDTKLGKTFSDKIKITYSDLKIYDENGKRIALKDGLDIAKSYKCPENRPIVRPAAAATKVTLRWNEIPGATKYRVLKVVNGKLKGVADTKELKYTIKKLTSGTEYKFAVKAYVNGKWTQAAQKDIVTVKTK